MPRLKIKEINRSAISVFERKEDMLKYVKKFAFENMDRLVIHRAKTKWIVYLLEDKEVFKK